MPSPLTKPEIPAPGNRDDTTEHLPLQGEQATLVQILETITDAFLALDREWRIAYANPEAARLFGKPVKALLGRSYWETWPEAAGGRIEEEYRRAVRDRTPVHFEHRFATADLRLYIRAYPVPDGLHIFFRDISERRRMEEALRESEQSLRLLADAIPHIVWITEAAQTGSQGVSYYNQRWYEYTGLKPRLNDDGPDGSDRDWARVIHPDDLAAVTATGRLNTAAGLPYRFEYRLRRHDGAYRWHTGRVVPVRDAEGNIVEWVGTGTDIDDTRRTRIELQDAAERLRLALRSARQATWDLDLTTGIGQISAEAGPMMGRAAISQPFNLESGTALVHPDDIDRVTAELLAAIQGGTDYDTEYRVLWEDGVTVHWVAANGIVLRDQETDAPLRAIGVLRDITREKEHEAAREALLAQQRRFLREMLYGLTEGRLRLCETEADLPLPLPSFDDPVQLSRQSLRQLRLQSNQAAETLGLPRERTDDLLTAVGEAGMNAVVHAGGGQGWVCTDPQQETVQVWVRDQGKGITEDALHRATLERGYSSAGTLGYGFWLMLKTCDRIYLLTGAEGTTVVLEQDRKQPEPSWLQATLAAS